MNQTPFTRRAEKLAALQELGKDTGMRISLQWRDHEITVFSWDAVAAYTGKKASTLRVYQSRKILPEGIPARHPVTGEWDDCQIFLISSPVRGRPEKVKGANVELLKKQITMAELRLEMLKLRLQQCQ